MVLLDAAIWAVLLLAQVALYVSGRRQGAERVGPFMLICTLICIVLWLVHLKP
jgi:hypothetical protein